MILLITGASHTGKTLLAQRLLERTKYPYLSIDHLKMGLIRSGQTKLTPMDDDALTDYLWPIVREMIRTAIENRQNLIVEGCYVPFDWRRDFDAGEAQEIRFVCLSMTDAYIDAHFDEIRDHASAIEARLDDAYCSKDWLKEENSAFLEGFQASGERVVCIETDFEQTLEALLREDWIGEIKIEEIPTAKLPEFWEAHLRYLIDDGIIEDEEDVEYFSGEEYRGILEAHMGRETDRQHMVWFLQNGLRIGAASYCTFQSEDGKCFLLDFWVFPAYRGNGTGHRCFAALERYTKADGAKYYELNSTKPDSVRFWKSLGFVKNGVDEYDMPLYIRKA